MTRLSQSVDHATALLVAADLAANATVRELLELTTQRRCLDLSDLSPAEQAILIAERSQELQPSADA
jgi:tyrosyl-tRNA synthetase